MRLLIQRVRSAEVVVEHQSKGKIGSGLLIFLGIESEDDKNDIEWLINKLCNLRIFSDSEGKMNLSVKDVGGAFLVISQFTLHASTKKGNRPSYIRAARPELAIPLYELFIESLENASGLNVESGVFGAHMDVTLLNDGPVTIFIDSKNRE